MSNVDADFFHIDSRTNMMMITGVLLFDEPVDFQRLRATYRYRMVDYYPRFRMRVRERGLLSGLAWEQDPHFDISAHIHRIAVPVPGDQAALQELAGDLVSTPLDYKKPPWQVHLVEDFSGGCAVIWRLSHCIADGAAIMQVLLDMADEEPGAPWPQPVEAHEHNPPLLTRLIVPAMSAVDSALRIGEKAVNESMETVLHPERALDAAKAAALGVTRFGAAYTLALSRLLLLAPDPHTAFKGKMGVAKRVAWSRPLALGEVKAAGKLLCGTVNDVLLAAVAGGLRRYLQSRGENTEGLNLRALVPINLRGPEEHRKLGTHAGLTYLSLPVGIEDARERLATVKKRMDAIKNSPEGQATFDMFNLVGVTPPQVTRLFAEVFSAKATGVMTNVPGPRQPIYLAGARLARILFWVPTAAGLSLGVSICSYNGDVTVGIQTSAALVPDPQNIVAGIEADFENMLDLAATPPRERSPASPGAAGLHR